MHTGEEDSCYLDGCASHQIIGKWDLSLQGDISIQALKCTIQSFLRATRKGLCCYFCFCAQSKEKHQTAKAKIQCIKVKLHIKTDNFVFMLISCQNKREK